jgi:hypothetical protein
VAEQATFVGVRIQGGLLPADLLSRLSSGTPVEGMSSGDYHLAAGETVREAANRLWAYLRGVWASYGKALEALPEGDLATSLTRERWLLVMLDQLGYGRVQTTSSGGITVEGKAFPVSHRWEQVPIHLLGAGVELDRRTAKVAGAAGASPQSMVQEMLNRSDEHQWALLSNGRVLRLLRDSTSLVGSAYVEFDLEAIFDGDLFSDFLLLFTLCHESRLEVRDPQVGPASCWLETWRTTALESGSRALNLLRDGVVEALQILGTGFLGHPDNRELRRRLDERELSLADYNHALLRVVYRLLFTFVAEDRGALLDLQAPAKARQLYLTYFSTDRLRRIARRRRGGRHGDKWRAQTLIWDALGSPEGRPELGLVGIGGLFERGELDFLVDAELSNESLLRAVRALSIIREQKTGFKRVVDHRNLGAEELGSIYESLLEFVPSWDAGTKQYSLGMAAGNARKTTGSYYTPSSLIDSLLDTALDPVLDQAGKADDPEAAYLNVTVCDPACGSGHFLVAAARRIAKRIAAIRTGDPEPPPAQVRSALRDVIARCIYGVDVNPLAAELAKVSLWLEAMEPGKPLAFLDAQIKVGNALVGTTPAMVAAGLPAKAFSPIEGDDKKFASALTKQNNKERSGQSSLFETDGLWATNRGLVSRMREIFAAQVLSLSDVHVREQRLKAYVESEEYRRQRLAADAWCAAFVWHKTYSAPKPVTHDVVGRIGRGDVVAQETLNEVERLAAEYRFFHWHLEFPHIFPTSQVGGGGSLNQQTGWYGGFDVVLGNPPWEHVELKEQEFFDARDPEIAKASGAKRKRLIAQLPETNKPLADEYSKAKRQLDGLRHFASSSGRYPLCGRGRIKTDSIFAESGRDIISGIGRFGMVLPTGIATDATTQYFFKDLVESASLASLYDFENRKPLFESVDSRFKFCLLTLTGREDREPVADFAFFAHDPSDLRKPNVRFGLTPDEIKLLNPNTGTCPVFRSRRDAEITLGIYRRVPVLINENDPVNGNPWGIKFMQGLFNMTSDSHLFRTRDELEAEGWTLYGNVFRKGAEQMLPLYEGKMIHLFNSKWATHDLDGSRESTEEERNAPGFLPLPRYWVVSAQVRAKLPGVPGDSRLHGYRWISNGTNERTLIASTFPFVGVGNSLAIIKTPYEGEVLVASLSAFVCDYVLRQKLGGQNVTFGTMQQLPIIGPEEIDKPCPWDGNVSCKSWIRGRFDACMDAGSSLRALHRRAELDAAFFHLYDVDHDDVDYIMGTFPIVERKDAAAHGEYRTKRLILEIYDQMAEAIRTGSPYRSPFDGVVAA